MQKLTNIKSQLKEAGLKATHQRLVIMNAVKEMSDHPSAEKVFSSIKANNPSISLGTVYKTLETLVNNGLLAKVATREGQMRYDPRLDNHGHIYLTNTKELVDYYDEELDTLIIDFFKRKRVNNLKIKNISVRINGEKLDSNKEVLIK
ncbi:MAG: transcriptional repressor [Bacteroidota bacterium]